MRLFRIFIRLVAAAVAAMVFSSCGNRDAGRIMDSAEDVMWTRPDSALAALESIDTLSFKTKAQSARYSLLYTMALNRNWIDTTDLRIIQPAVNYYERHGSKDDKMKMYYYLGTVQHIAGDLEDAIASYVSFYRLNKDFPSDRRFHSFLLGADSHPVFVGNPLHDEELSKIFEKVLDRNLGKPR